MVLECPLCIGDGVLTDDVYARYQRDTDRGLAAAALLREALRVLEMMPRPQSSTWDVRTLKDHIRAFLRTQPSKKVDG